MGASDDDLAFLPIGAQLSGCPAPQPAGLKRDSRRHRRRSLPAKTARTPQGSHRRPLCNPHRSPPLKSEISNFKSSVSCLRAEIPGKFSVLPTKATAMCAPELKANSDEFKVQIHD